jgi:phage terminase large subunit-like protein
LDTRHATERQEERSITRPELLKVLRTGFHEKKKDQFKEEYQAWNYAIRGKTVDERNLRVIVSFDLNGMLIISAIDLDR